MNETDYKSCPGGPGHAAYAYEGGFQSAFQRDCTLCMSPVIPFKVGDHVLKFTGDYQLEGEVRAAFTTLAGKVRYVVEHKPGFLHIYSAANLRFMGE